GGVGGAGGHGEEGGGDAECGGGYANAHDGTDPLVLGDGWSVRARGPGGVVGVVVSARGGAGSPRTWRASSPPARSAGCTRRCRCASPAAGVRPCSAARSHHGWRG